MGRRFTGDFSGGDLSQWPQVANKITIGDTRLYAGGYPLEVVPLEGDCGYCTRVEVRAGDVPAFGGGERSELFGTTVTDVLAGETAWYAWSTKFDESFPSDHASLGWADVIQWARLDTSGVGVSTGNRSRIHRRCYTCRIFLDDTSPQTVPGVYDLPGGSQMILQQPLNLGQWHDFKMQMKVSSDPTQGFVKVWHNGVPQTMLGGTTTFTGATMVPTVPGVKVQEGYYPQAGIAATGVVYRIGCNIADSEASL